MFSSVEIWSGRSWFGEGIHKAHSRTKALSQSGYLSAELECPYSSSLNIGRVYFSLTAMSVQIWWPSDWKGAEE